MIIEKTKENLKKCICMKCPSYTIGCKMKNMPGMMMHKIKGDLDKLDHFERLFCAYNKSNCITEEKGCTCPQCPVAIENGLKKTYFCTVTNGK